MPINQKRVIDEFIELVQIDSFAGQEREIADALFKKLTKLGCKVTEDEAGKTIQGNAGNLIAKLPGNSNKPTLLFCAHMDRVAPGNNIKPIIENEIIKSDGTTILAADDVAGIVAILEGIRVAKEQGIKHGNIEIVFTIAEEGGLNGAKALDVNNLEAKLGYFLDASGPVGTIVNQAPSHKDLDFTFYGKAAHAGLRPEKGINAILVAAHALANMNIGRIDFETTANVGIIKGGTATNIVADKTEVKCEIRSLDADKLQKQIDHMIKTAEKTAQQFVTKVDIEITDCYPAFTIPESEPVVTLAVKAAETIGLEPVVEGTGGGSDANIVNGLGIPSVVLGLNFQDVHSTNESIAIADLVKSCELVLSIIENA